MFHTDLKNSLKDNNLTIEQVAVATGRAISTVKRYTGSDKNGRYSKKGVPAKFVTAYNAYIESIKPTKLTLKIFNLKQLVTNIGLTDDQARNIMEVKPQTYSRYCAGGKSYPNGVPTKAAKKLMVFVADNIGK